MILLLSCHRLPKEARTLHTSTQRPDEDEGPGGSCVDDEPMVVGGRDPQRDSHPEDKNQKLGLAQLEYRLDRQSNFSAAKPREKVPGKGHFLARTTHNLDTVEYFEDRRIVAGLTQEELTQKLP
eukprot:2222017-Pyramimonas_sp.AAC.1